MAIFLVIILLMGFSGCATTSHKTETDQIQARVVELEKKLEEKDSEIVDLQYEVKDLSSKVESKNSQAAVGADEDLPVTPSPGNDGVVRVNAAADKIQTALKNAGYYTGKIDGKIGVGTKGAIVEFQKSKGLKADGVLGRKTWNALKQYLN